LKKTNNPLSAFPRTFLGLTALGNLNVSVVRGFGGAGLFEIEPIPLYLLYQLICLVGV